MEVIKATFNYLLNWISPGKPYDGYILYAIHSYNCCCWRMNIWQDSQRKGSSM